ncbi:MAG: pili assembly chaperone [Pseudomonadota bacterium]
MAAHDIGTLDPPLLNTGLDMKTRTFDVRRPLLAALGIAAACMAITRSNAAEVQVGRYSTLPAMPSVAQADLLAATITVVFPARVHTVGEAVQYVLQRSGYRLAAEEVMGSESADLLALPLPAVHRHLGPVTLAQALETLVGPAFRLIHDPVHRLISFELCVSTGRATQQLDSSSTKEAPHDGE